MDIEKTKHELDLLIWRAHGGDIEERNVTIDLFLRWHTERLQEERNDLIDLQNRCNVCICAEGSTDECCRSCIAGGPDIFTQLAAAKKLMAALYAGGNWKTELEEFERMIAQDKPDPSPTVGTSSSGPTVTASF